MSPIDSRFAHCATSRPEPPRDLWARTAAGIEREAGGRGRAGRATSRRSRLPLGAISGIAVIAIVLGATALSGAWNRRRARRRYREREPRCDRPTAAATPMLVAAGSVGWVRTLEDGAYAYNVAALEEVCPMGDRPDCAALDDQAFERLDLAAAPKSVIGSPTDGQAIVVGQDASGRQSIFVVSLPEGRHGDAAADARRPSPRRRRPTDRDRHRDARRDGQHDPERGARPDRDPGHSRRRSRPRPDRPTNRPRPPNRRPPRSPARSSRRCRPRPRCETPSPEPTVALKLAIASGVSVVGSRPPSRLTGTGSPSRLDPPTRRPARTSTSGGSVTSRPVD